MGAARLEVAGFRFGGGAWLGKGEWETPTLCSRTSQAKPLAHDLPRRIPRRRATQFRGVFGNLSHTYRGTTVALGRAPPSFRKPFGRDDRQHESSSNEPRVATAFSANGFTRSS